jgi:hypothetical protein
MNDRDNYEVKYRIYNSSEIHTEYFSHYPDAVAFIEDFPDSLEAKKLTVNSNGYGRRFTGEVFEKQCMEAFTAKKSCAKSCSPSDYYRGGKCDLNGCFENPSYEVNPAVEDFKKITSSICQVLTEKE